MDFLDASFLTLFWFFCKAIPAFLLALSVLVIAVATNVVAIIVLLVSSIGIVNKESYWGYAFLISIGFIIANFYFFIYPLLSPYIIY